MEHHSVLHPLLPPPSGVSAPLISVSAESTGPDRHLHTGVNASSGTLPLCLLVRRFPHWLGREEKESLMIHFGAREVIVMPTKGKMRNCVFAMFSNPDDSRRAMNKLHQLDVFGCRLVVEYARPLHVKMVQETELDRWSCNTSKLPETSPEGETPPPLPPADPEPLPIPPSSHAPRYLYPPPNLTVINNITNAIACVPKLYVQVLDIMNKMNLPPPFGPPTPTPPLVGPGITVSPSERDTHRQFFLMESTRDNEDEDEGSEIDSDEETKKILTTRSEHAHRVAKRRIISYKDIKGLLPPMKKGRGSSESEELQRNIKHRVKMEFHIPIEITPSKTATAAVATPSEPTTITLIGGATPSVISDEGNSVVCDDQQQATMGEEDHDGREQGGVETEKFISLTELMANRLSEAEMKEEHVFRNYSPGEPSVRLYVKNLAKQVSEQDLRYVFGRFVNWSLEEEKNMFDVRVMTSGRMKGQAFIGLPSEEAAVSAVGETNGHILHGKPMVVNFARSSRPKDTKN